MEDSLITWLLVTICSSSMVRNPYLVAKLVEVVFVILPTIQPRCEMLHLRLLNHHIAQTMLPSALMKFYTDVETTGSSSEFYDKFSIRYHISLIIKSEFWSVLSDYTNNKYYFFNFRNVGFSRPSSGTNQWISKRQSVREIHQHADEWYDVLAWRIVGVVKAHPRSPRFS